MTKRQRRREPRSTRPDSLPKGAYRLPDANNVAAALLDVATRELLRRDENKPTDQPTSKK
jgi:hypothetical protein